jgi:hypothetical protein
MDGVILDRLQGRREKRREMDLAMGWGKLPSKGWVTSYTFNTFFSMI